MPNVKIFVDDGLFAAVSAPLRAALADLRADLCRALSVAPPACQIAVIPVSGLPDQPQVNLELMIMPAPDRTRDAMTGLARHLQRSLAATTGAHVAIRIAFLDPASYVALK